MDCWMNQICARTTQLLSLHFLYHRDGRSGHVGRQRRILRGALNVRSCQFGYRERGTGGETWVPFFVVQFPLLLCVGWPRTVIDGMVPDRTRRCRCMEELNFCTSCFDPNSLHPASEEQT